jgi:hypothetical protein
MSIRWIIGCHFLALASLLISERVLAAAASQQTEHDKGVTVNDLTRGVRSAAHNIEKEIPKIGPAIGKTLKSIGRNSSETTGPQAPASDKK